LKSGREKGIKPGGEPLFLHIPSWFRESESNRRRGIRTCLHPGGSEEDVCAPVLLGGSECRKGSWLQIVQRRTRASSWGSWPGGVVYALSWVLSGPENVNVQGDIKRGSVPIPGLRTCTVEVPRIREISELGSYTSGSLLFFIT